MATCNPNTLLASGAAFQGLGSQGLRLVCIGSLVTKLSTVYVGLDVTPSGVLARGKLMQSLDDQGIRNVIYQSLCVLTGG